MKALLNGCAAFALIAGFAGHANAQVEVQHAPIHTIPADSAADAAAPADATPAAVKVLVQTQAPPVAAPALSPDETVFFAALGHRVTDAASAYQGYVSHAGTIDAAFADAGAVHDGLKAGSAYQPQQLQEGVVAYAGLLALRDQAFVDGVRARRDPAFADRLTASPQAVLEVPGAQDAAADVTNVLRIQSERLLAEGKAISQAAYDVQSQPWSKLPVANPVEVLAETKAAAAQPRAATVESEKQLLQSLLSAPQPSPQAAASASPEVVRGLALAALAVLGRVGDSQEANFQPLLLDAANADCLKVARMNLNQCLAAAGPHYEDVFCLGRHAVGETAKCVSDAAVGTGGAPAAPAPRMITATVDSIGPEEAAAYGYPAGHVDHPDLDRADLDDPLAPSDDTPRTYAQIDTQQRRYQAAMQPRGYDDGMQGESPIDDDRAYAPPADSRGGDPTQTQDRPRGDEDR